jgi:hypothetical protein
MLSLIPDIETARRGGMKAKKTIARLAAACLLFVAAIAAVSAARAQNSDIQMLPPSAEGSSPTNVIPCSGFVPFHPLLLGWDGQNPINCITGLYADPSGNLGVGNPNPQATLDVTGTFNVSGTENVGSTLTINGTAAMGSSCSTPGTLANDGTTGAILNCVNVQGTDEWIKLGSLVPSSENPVCNLDVWPVGGAQRVNCSGGGHLVSATGAGTNYMLLIWSTNNPHTLCVMSAYNPDIADPAACQVDIQGGGLWTLTLSAFKGSPVCRMSCFD